MVKHVLAGTDLFTRKLDDGERASVSVVFLRPPMALAFSGRPSAIGAPSVAVLVADSVDKPETKVKY